MSSEPHLTPEQPGLTRWAIRVSDFPYARNSPAFNHLTSLLPPDERTRISRYLRPVDAIRALIGQILIRRLVLNYFPSANWEDVVVERTEHGKPYLSAPSSQTFNFNISHHENYVIIAAGYTPNLGVDVTHISLPPPLSPSEPPLQSFLNCFDREFTKNEWAHIRQDIADERRTLTRFYTYWCLKESYVKALGLGLGVELWRVEFTWKEMDGWGKDDKILQSDVTVALDGITQRQWKFEVSFLDKDHPAAVCLSSVLRGVEGKDITPAPFEILDWESITDKIPA
ncbi:hypothetical protein HDV00_000357 [Rhizophlyctis rosea]|nr:hypothetical protein HDV00_000357 [Rhizophlyctis rosea]